LIARLITAVIVFALSMFCGLVIVANGLLAGRYNSMYPFAEDIGCAAGEKLILETDATTTTGSTVVIDGTAFDGMGYSQNTIYCVDETSGEKYDVTNEIYEHVETLKTQIGWGTTFAFFAVTMTLILVFERPILKMVDKIIGYKPANGS
jgi:hypothetical protein